MAAERRGLRKAAKKAVRKAENMRKDKTKKNLADPEVKPKKKKTGPKPKKIDWDKIDGLCRFFAPAQEIAAYVKEVFFDVSYDTLDRQCKKKFGQTFGDYVKQKQDVRSRYRLRVLQWKAAEEGNVTMLIWLGKNYLDQSDSKVEGENKEPLPLINYRDIAV
ncbi:MAG TPA: hypothetical protein P5244_03605 [Syntrophales bacterium]|nr:hypothetical protein [Syntrophales bacterium]